MNVEVVSFDLWGTLVDYGDRDAEAAWRVAEFRRVLAQFGHRLDDAVVKQAVLDVRAQTFDEQRRTGVQFAVRDQVAAMTRRMGLTDDQELLDVLLIAHTHAVLRACPQLIPGAADALTAIRSGGHRLVLTSNTLATPGEVTGQLLAQLGIAEAFETCVYSSDVGLTKPRPEVFAAITARTGTPAGRIVHIGNEWRSDVQGALDAGLQAIWFNPHSKPNPSAAPAITHLSQVPDAIRTLTRTAAP